MTEPWDQSTFTEKLRAVGSMAYHDKHPFHLQMNAGLLGVDAIRGWIANRFYYQCAIPSKDAAILANCPLRDVRRLWLHRITDHDGTTDEEGGIEAWLRLGHAAGLSRDELLNHSHLMPAVRFAVDAYVHLARTSPWPVAVASSLTELFAPDLMSKRLEAFERCYPWIHPSGFDYFRRRLTQARRDSGEALTLTLEHCRTHEDQQAAVRALMTKCDILWAVLDGIALKYAPELLTRHD